MGLDAIMRCRCFEERRLRLGQVLYEDLHVDQDGLRYIARVGRRDRYADTGVYFPKGEGYEDLYALKGEVECSLGDADARLIWSEPDDNKKRKALWLRRDFDYDEQDWSGAQVWMRDTLLRLWPVVLSTASS